MLIIKLVSVKDDESYMLTHIAMYSFEVSSESVYTSIVPLTVEVSELTVNSLKPSIVISASTVLEERS